LCIQCRSCIPYCPVVAIKATGDKIEMDQDLCVDCGVCIRAGVCRVNAIYLPETPWPRAIRAAFSGGGLSFYPPGKRFKRDPDRPELERRRYDRIEQKMSLPKMDYDYVKNNEVGGGSRGTPEVKTNDRTGKFGYGEVGMACEMGRPGVSFCFRDVEKVASALANIGIEFEPENPISIMLDPSTGTLKDYYSDIRDERALSSIIEFKISDERTPEVYKTLQDVAKEIDTVFSLNIINRCENGKPPLKKNLDEAGINVRINGKTNIGLGRPLAE
jgi:NAD-dependent dihydropyrimidine dehydrogenase PreA subunit